MLALPPHLTTTLVKACLPQHYQLLPGFNQTQACDLLWTNEMQTKILTETFGKWEYLLEAIKKSHSRKKVKQSKIELRDRVISNLYVSDRVSPPVIKSDQLRVFC